MEFECVEVGGGAVALVGVKSVLGKLVGGSFHESVPFYFGGYTGGGYAEAQAVPFYHRGMGPWVARDL
jgi:hypothetical protein